MKLLFNILNTITLNDPCLKWPLQAALLRGFPKTSLMPKIYPRRSLLSYGWSEEWSVVIYTDALFHVCNSYSFTNPYGCHSCSNFIMGVFPEFKVWKLLLLFLNQVSRTSIASVWEANTAIHTSILWENITENFEKKPPYKMVIDSNQLKNRCETTVDRQANTKTNNTQKEHILNIQLNYTWKLTKTFPHPCSIHSKNLFFISVLQPSISSWNKWRRDLSSRDLWNNTNKWNPSNS